ncbi:hypothetical protein CD178_02270 [Komagataeibacter saccharivorans]|uniref:Uncharacterized protein n=1 Tax=Komagataeibacter saccharivorans TaxID=265959 RepID=A0A347WDS8_9PROT|nr:hypothetical protein CD178_02270 [Komagataeibacter saccharivorans]PMP98761.1 hypothetical protein S101450_00548 [Komagataeibacter saccharivorans]QBL93063.1 hypothetical protein KSAC_08210 [Komagataeibacter saccharivorans]
MGRPFVPWHIGRKALDRTHGSYDVLRPLGGSMPAMMPEDT